VSGHSEDFPGFEPHNPRGIAGHAWYDAAASYDLAALPELAVRALLAGALEHVRQMLEELDTRDAFEDHMDELGLDDHLDCLRVVSAEQAETLGQALADAIERRTPGGFCHECERARG
jgi:hypothetical protein